MLNMINRAHFFMIDPYCIKQPSSLLMLT